MIASAVLAQASGGVDVLGRFVDAGLVGVVLILIIVGRVRLEREVKDRDERIAKLETENDRKQSIIESSLPLLAKATELVGDAARRSAT